MNFTNQVFVLIWHPWINQLRSWTSFPDVVSTLILEYGTILPCYFSCVNQEQFWLWIFENILLFHQRFRVFNSPYSFFLANHETILFFSSRARSAVSLQYLPNTKKMKHRFLCKLNQSRKSLAGFDLKFFSTQMAKFCTDLNLQYMIPIIVNQENQISFRHENRFFCPFGTLITTGILKKRVHQFWRLQIRKLKKRKRNRV